MNRAKKEEMRKHREARQGLTPEEIKALDVQDAENNMVENLTRKIHAEKFSEEYDFMCDSIADANDRKNGKSPMNDAYIAKINKKRQRLGVTPLSENGMSTSLDTWDLCQREAKESINNIRMKIDEIIFYKWDPLQISKEECLRDEYRSYMPEIFRLALESETFHPIADHLSQVSTEYMSMEKNKKHDTEIAKLIFAVVNKL